MPFVTAAGRSIAYERLEGNEPALVFLHEGLGSIRQWRDFPQRVAQATGCAVLVYDRYGYGGSEVLAEERVSLGFMHDEALVSLPQILAALGIEAPVLIGHSDGASIALIHAGAGKPVRGLAVMAPHVFVEEMGLSSIERAREQFETTDLRERLGRYHTDPRKTFYLWNDAWLHPDFRRWNIEEYLPGIRCPVLAIQGEQDEYGTMAQLEAICSSVKGNCQKVKLARCGHSPHRDQPEATLDAIARFVKSLA
ncbi:MAG TPA: alpha/beta hydrolase [Burkholderiales bacterium]|nr:alpha/beta hydrolase [Burkholderiales bacterium]